MPHSTRSAECCSNFRFAHSFAAGSCELGEMNGEEASESEQGSWFRWGHLDLVKAAACNPSFGLSISGRLLAAACLLQQSLARSQAGRGPSCKSCQEQFDPSKLPSNSRFLVAPIFTCRILSVVYGCGIVPF